MKRVILIVATALLAVFPVSLRAADHRVEMLKEPAPADELAPAIAATLQPEGVKVIRGTSRTVCEIWLCKEWKLNSFEVGSDLLYPFVPGQLIGVVRFPRRGADFRDQDIDSGVYTLRYAQQPVDGAHVGTSPTRDFLLLVPADKDRSPAILAYTPLTQASAEAAGTTHPALLSLQKLAGEQAVRHDEDRDWWIVRLNSTAKAGEQSRPLGFDLVVAGQAVE